MLNGLARRILVPTDFSEASQASLAYAISLVEQSNATPLLLGHVTDEVVRHAPCTVLSVH